MPDLYPPYIFGMHDRGGEHLMIEKNKRGWVLVTEAIGADPANSAGSNYTDLVNQGLGVLVRLNNGYGVDGTIPHSSQYDNFAQRCGNFVQASPGCHAWIIGNEMNLAAERPGGPNGQTITPQLYASCFARCRSEIRRRPGHETDQVLVGAIGPWNTQTKYSGNLNGDWVQYLADTLALLGQEVDGITIHTYTHGTDPALVFSDATMNAPFQAYHYQFRAYRDFMAAIPDALRDRPVYITETDENDPWRDQNSGWVRNAYLEIDNWNRDPNHQPIQALILYRWIIGNANDPQQVGWAIVNKPGVQNDFREAMNNEYGVIQPAIKPEYLAAWLEVAVPGRMEPGASVAFAIQVRNDGRLTWANSGIGAVQVGYRWVDAVGEIDEGPRTVLPHAVAPGETVTIPAMTVQAPQVPGFYTLDIDLVQGASGWFADRGSPPWTGEIRVGDRYRVSWLQVDAPAEGIAGETVQVPVRMRNDGALTWLPDGDNPFHLTYKWLDENRQVVVADGLRTSLDHQVPPLGEITLEANVQFPAQPGAYILQMDMVQEFVTWFQWKGSPVYEAQVAVEPAVPDYAAEWLTYVGPDRLFAGRSGTAVLEIQNSGAQPWPRTGEDAIRLGYRWLDAQGQEVPVAGAETWPLSKTVEPGETVTLRDVVLVAPQQPGAYSVVWDLVQGDAWLSSRGVAVLQRSMQVVAPEYGVAWQVLRPWPAWMPPAQEQKADLMLRNIGTRTWAAGGEHPVHLAHNWFTSDGKATEPWDTFRYSLPADVPAGDSVTLLGVPFQTPGVLGNYVLRWDLVEEGETWFFRQGGSPLEVAVEISDRVLVVPWTAQASHNVAETGLAFDGDPQTAWDSQVDQEPGMWFQVDLGQDLVLDRIRVASPGRGFPVGYKVKLSLDGQDWHLVAEKAQNWSDIDVACAPCRARYLRLEQIGQPSWPASWMIAEISVSVTEAWAGADASHYAGDTPKAYDARLRTAWNTRAVKQRPGMWFELDMGNLWRIEGVTLEHPTSQMPRGYVVSVAGDDKNWQQVARKDDNWGQVDVRFSPVVARYVRVETTNSSAYYPWGIAEFVIWRAAPVWLVGRQEGQG